tara:strand:+ start:128 stop:304 length:177 start_codon:yes stop_codon:yes gene_type:complete
MTDDEKEELYASWKCQECQGEGDMHETLWNDGGSTEVQGWIYCKKCDIETFYEIPDDY